MGRSYNDWNMAHWMRTNAGAIPDNVEVWGVNAVARTLKVDRLYHMDPVGMWFDGITHTKDTEAHGREMTVEPWPQMAEALAGLEVPIYTAKPDDRVPSSVRYPLEEVMEHVKFPYFNTTVAYAIAHAILEGRPKIYLFGCDFTYSDMIIGEAGRACAEFWMGYAYSRGTELYVPGSCTLLDNWRPNRVLYGFGQTLEDMTNETGSGNSDGDGGK